MEVAVISESKLVFLIKLELKKWLKRLLAFFYYENLKVYSKHEWSKIYRASPQIFMVNELFFYLEE